MYCNSYLIFINLFVGAVIANIPATIYRGETSRRTPGDVKRAGGFHSHAAISGQHPNMDLFRHALHGTEDNDPYISTSSNKIAAGKFTLGNGFVYHIDTRSKPHQYIDVCTRLADHPGFNLQHEAEFASFGTIPFSDIITVDVIKNGEFIKSQANPDYRPGGQAPAPAPVPAPAPAGPHDGQQNGVWTYSAAHGGWWRISQSTGGIVWL